MADEKDLRIIPIDIEEEMKSSYIDYSMSVIVSRALPDVRDGLKPVQRRVLYGMSDLDLGPTRPQKKSARIVGEVLGKYHPHGDSAVYAAMVRMAQDFSVRYPLVDGQGNFGSIDGDSAAAMRYTEARMTRLSAELLRDLDKNTVDFRSNFDDSLEEPSVLPATVPALLLNGASGIAVGMATNIPPHNLGEVIDGVVAYIDDNDITIDELIGHIPAPDFPTGSTIFGYGGVLSAYKTGRGKIRQRAKIHEEEFKKDRIALIITEIPYQVNKSTLVEKIAFLVRDKRVDGISDLRDESDRDGMRVVIELRRDAVSDVVKNQLYKFTDLQKTFGANMVSLVNGRPRLLNLKEMIQYYAEHRHEVVTRRTQFDLDKAEKRAHILEGLKIALDHLDAVISIIRYSADPDTAKANLMAGVFPEKLSMEMRRRFELPLTDDSMFTLSEEQAKAILELRLARLTGLERQKIEDEYDAVMAEIARLKEILGDKSLRMAIIRDELLDIKDRYADPRRTMIDKTGGEDIELEDIIENDKYVVTISNHGLIKRTSVSEYRNQGRGGKGLKAAGTREEDFVSHVFASDAHDYLLFFTDKGKCYWLRVYQIPEAGRTGKGKNVRNLIEREADDRVKAILNVTKENFRDEDFLNNNFVLMATRSGKVKKTSMKLFSRPRSNGIRAISVGEEDELIEARMTNGDSLVVLASSGGRSIQFKESDARPMGRDTQGVRGMRLREGEKLVGMFVVDNDEKQLLTLSANGYGKRSDMDGFPLQGRGGSGVITHKKTERTGELVYVMGVMPDDDLVIITKNGTMIRMAVDGISTMSRNTQGVRLINLKDGDEIADVARMDVTEDGTEEGDSSIEDAEFVEIEAGADAEEGETNESADDDDETSEDEETEGEAEEDSDEE